MQNPDRTDVHVTDRERVPLRACGIVSPPLETEAIALAQMEKQYRNVLVLSGCQATLQTTGTTMIAVTGLAGAMIATNPAFATVPLTCYVVGAALTTIPAS